MTHGEIIAFMAKAPTRPHACRWHALYRAALPTFACAQCGARAGEGCRLYLDTPRRVHALGSYRVPPPMFDAHRSRRERAWEAATRENGHGPVWHCAEAA